MSKNKLFRNITTLRIFTFIFFISVVLLGVLRLNESKTPIDYSLDALLPSFSENTKEFGYFKDVVSKEILYLLIAKDDEKAKDIISSVDNLFRQLSNIKPDIYINASDFQKFYYENRYIYANFPVVCNDCSDEQKISKFKEHILAQLYNPFGGYTSFEITHDPFMAMRSIISKNEQQFKYSDFGVPYINYQGSKAYIIRGVITNSLTSSELKQLFEESVNIKNIAQQKGMTLYFTGESFFSHAATEQSTSDMTRIGVVSTVILIVLLVIVYKGILPLCLTIITLCISLTTGLLSVFAIYGTIHAMTLAMSMCLIGICVDYCIHVFTALNPTKTGEQVRRELLKPLIFSLLTSVIAYSLLAFTNLLVLKELALFAVVSLVMTFLFLFAFLTSLKKTIKPNYFIANTIFRFLLLIPKKLIYILVIVCLSISMFNLSKSSFDNDVGHMQSRNEELSLMNQQILDIVNGYSKVSYYIIKAKNLNESLNKCHQLYDSLDKDTRKDAFFPCELIPSEEKQISKIKQYASMYPYLKEVFNEQGINLIDDNNSFNKKVITYTDYPKDIKGLFGENAILLKVNPENKKLVNILENDANIVKMDFRAYWSDAFALYNYRLNIAFVLAFVIALLGLTPILKKSIFLNLLIPLLTGCCCGYLAVVYLAAGYFNLFTTLAFFMLLGLGADYCIFMYFLNKNNKINVIQSITVACLTTLASFGALAMSNTNVMASFGIVIAFGLSATALFAMLMKISVNKEKFNDLS